MKTQNKAIVILISVLILSGVGFYVFKKDSMPKQYKPVFLMPIEGANIPKYPGYLPNAPRHYRDGIHEGIELSAKENSPVKAALSGEIIEASTRESIDGNFVMIKHKENWTSKYSHLSKIDVYVGQKVKTRDIIGLTGCTGNCIRPHLDFTIYKPDGTYLGKGYDDELELQLLLSTYIQ